MPDYAKRLLRVGIKTWLDFKPIRNPLMMNSWLMRGICNVHIMVNDIHDQLRHRIDDPASARASKDQEWVAIFEDHCWRLRTYRALPRFNFVGLTGDETGRAFNASANRKGMDLIVEQDPRALDR